MFDAHCHLQDVRVTDSAGQIDRARRVGLRGFLLAGVDPDDWDAQQALARAHAGVYRSFGVHPQRVDELLRAGRADALARMIAQLAARLDHAGARPEVVGEIGLDGVRERKDTLDRQERAFREQLALARAADLPIALHVLRAHGRALAILERDGVPGRGGMVHSWSGAAELVPRYVRLGLHISFAGAITHADSRRAHESAPRVPIDRLLVETDAPDQLPVGAPAGDAEAARNEPAYLPLVVAALAAARGQAPAEIASHCEMNARRLLGLDEAAAAARSP